MNITHRCFPYIARISALSAIFIVLNGFSISTFVQNRGISKVGSLAFVSKTFIRNRTDVPILYSTVHNAYVIIAIIIIIIIIGRRSLFICVLPYKILPYLS
jgi:hypothetical protein